MFYFSSLKIVPQTQGNLYYNNYEFEEFNKKPLRLDSKKKIGERFPELVKHIKEGNTTFFIKLYFCEGSLRRAWEMTPNPCN